MPPPKRNCLCCAGYSSLDLVTTFFKVIKGMESLPEALKLDFLQQVRLCPTSKIGVSLVYRFLSPFHFPLLTIPLSCIIFAAAGVRHAHAGGGRRGHTAADAGSGLQAGGDSQRDGGGAGGRRHRGGQVARTLRMRPAAARIPWPAAAVWLSYWPIYKAPVPVMNTAEKYPARASISLPLHAIVHVFRGDREVSKLKFN